MKRGHRYDHAFKLEAIKLVTERGMTKTQVCHDLGMSIPTLTTWIEKYGQDRQQAEQGRFLDAELRRLQKENETLRIERDILKKATAFFARESN